MVKKYINENVIGPTLYTRTKTGVYRLLYRESLLALQGVLDRSKKGAVAKAADKVDAALDACPPPNGKSQAPPPDILPDPTTVTEANKQKLIYQAKRERVKYEQEIGKLVDKEQVYKELFKRGQEIREALLAVPDRVIDQLRAAKSRAKAHKILTDAIHEELTRLGKTDQT